MENDKAIIVKNISKKYMLYNNAKEKFLNLITSKDYGEEFWALKNISFSADKGEVIGFIGINGSGKSTLSNIIAGVVPESGGTLEVSGQTSLIAVSAGLKTELTGRDNIELKLLMLGFNKKEIIEIEQEIIDFSELDKFIDQPVKSYSSGMKSRLGFAISVSVNPDVLIIDEALSVGDKAFAEKSLTKMNEFKEEGKTMIFVSHSIGQMKRFCTKILWLEFGKIKEYGKVSEVIPNYEEFLLKWQRMSRIERDNYKKAALSIESEHETKINIDEFYKPHSEFNKVIEKPASKLVHFKSGIVYLSSYPNNNEDENSDESTKHLKHAVYYVKKEATYQDELYYLLSTERSAVDGVIGWVKTKYLSIHDHIFVDSDVKDFILKGTGMAYTDPWGGKKQEVFANLNEFEGMPFKAEKTEFVGRNIWYQGKIKDKLIWLNSTYLK